MTTPTTTCSVCLEPFEANGEAICGACGLPYHLNQRNDLIGKDCGQVWISEEHLALQFACDRCLNPAPPAADLSEVLDATEAAALADMAEAELVAAAEAGRVRFRRTGSGVYLFERGDVAGLTRGDR